MCKPGTIKVYTTLSLGLVLWLGVLLGQVPQQALADSNAPTATPIPTNTIAVTLPPTDTPIPTSTATEGAPAQEDTDAKGLGTSPVEDAGSSSQSQANSQPWTSSISVIDVVLIAAIVLVGLVIMGMVVFYIIRQQW